MNASCFAKLAVAVFVSIFLALPAFAGSREDANELYGASAYVKPYVPTDLKFPTTNHRGYYCGTDGSPVSKHPEDYGSCQEFVSASDQIKMRVRFSGLPRHQGAAERIFLITEREVDGKRIEEIKLHVRFDMDNGSKAVDISPLAEKYAQTNGGGTQTAKKESPPAQVATASGCTALPNDNARIACEQGEKQKPSAGASAKIGSVLDGAAKAFKRP